MDFTHVDKGFGRTMVLIPGWGFGPSIFSMLTLPWNFILPAGPVYGDVSAGLHKFVASRALAPVAVLGWSMGASLALCYSANHPEDIGLLVLVSLRDTFSQAEIQGQLDALRRDPRGALRHFYRRCFLGQKEDYRWFVETLEEATLQTLDLQGLMQGLHFLAGAAPDVSFRCPRSLRMFHGSRDAVTPLHRAALPPAGAVLEVLQGMGHACFLSPEFERRLGRLEGENMPVF